MAHHGVTKEIYPEIYLARTPACRQDVGARHQQHFNATRIKNGQNRVMSQPHDCLCDISLRDSAAAQEEAHARERQAHIYEGY